MYSVNKYEIAHIYIYINIDNCTDMTVEIVVCADTSGETVRSSTDALTCWIINYIMWVWTVLFCPST